MSANRYVQNYPVIGIRPTIDGRRAGQGNHRGYDHRQSCRSHRKTASINAFSTVSRRADFCNTSSTNLQTVILQII